VLQTLSTEAHEVVLQNPFESQRPLAQSVFAEQPEHSGEMLQLQELPEHA
jgi:hypothetical protein